MSLIALNIQTVYQTPLFVIVKRKKNKFVVMRTWSEIQSPEVKIFIDPIRSWPKGLLPFLINIVIIIYSCPVSKTISKTGGCGGGARSCRLIKKLCFGSRATRAF